MTSSSKIILRIQIERARQKLHLLAQECGELSHPKIIKQSMRLDELINRYNRIEKEKLKKPIA